MKNKKNFRVLTIMAMLTAMVFFALSLAGCADAVASIDDTTTLCRHIWVDGAVLLEPNCEDTGLLEQYCSECGAVGLPKELREKHEAHEETGICTLCGDLAYYIGDTGPGGGTIYFRAPAGFNYYYDTTGTLTSPSATPHTAPYRTVHYLECAPADMPEPLVWSLRSLASFENYTIPGMYGEDTAARVSVPGTGRRNTLLILATEPDAPAALACYEYRAGGKDDWYLPSRAELELLFFYRIYHDNFELTKPNYWASSIVNNMNSWDYDLSNGDNNGRNRFNAFAVRAIRAF